jgi:hypothetical protein
MVRVTGREPQTVLPSVAALGFRLVSKERTNSATGAVSTEEMLRIYRCDRIDYLLDRVEDRQCSRNDYRRAPN